MRRRVDTYGDGLVSGVEWRRIIAYSNPRRSASNVPRGDGRLWAESLDDVDSRETFHVPGPAVTGAGA